MTAYHDLILNGSNNVSYWQMDETSGTTIDCETYGTGVDLNFLLTNADVNQTGPNADEKAIYFDRGNGSNEYLMTNGLAGGLTNITTGTVEFWWKAPAGVGASEQVIIGDRDSWSIMSDSNDKLKLYFAPSGGSDSQVFIDCVIADDNWHHIVVHFTFGTTTGNYAYVDGVSVSTGFNTGSTGTVSNTYKIGVAALDGYTVNKGGGYMSNLAIYPGTLSSGDITAHYNSMKGVIVEPPVANVTFTGLDAGVSAGGSVSQAVDNAPAVSWTGLAPTIGTGNTVTTDAAPNVTWTMNSYQPQHMKVLRDGPIFMYLLDSTTASLTDITGNGNTGSRLVGASLSSNPVSVTGNQGDSGYPGFKFNNSQSTAQDYISYITTAPTSTTFVDNWSYEFWFSPRLSSATIFDPGAAHAPGTGGAVAADGNVVRMRFEQNGTSKWAYFLDINNSSNEVFDTGSSVYPGYGGSNDWHHVAVTCSTSGSTRTVKFYMDGILKWTGTTGSTVRAQKASNNTIVFTTQNVNTYYDNIAFFDYALSGVQVAAHALDGTDINVDATTATIEFAGQSATVAAGLNAFVDADVANVSWQGLTPSLAINGAVEINADPVNMVWVGQMPTVSVQASIEQLAVNLPDIIWLSPSPNVITRPDDLTFVFVHPDAIEFTARDAQGITGISFGTQFQGETKTRAFRLGNTSTIPTSLNITATSLNTALAAACTFSLDKNTWSSSLLIENIRPNAVSDVVYIKLALPDSAFVGDGTFVISVEQNA